MARGRKGRMEKRSTGDGYDNRILSVRCEIKVRLDLFPPPSHPAWHSCGMRFSLSRFIRRPSLRPVSTSCIRMHVVPARTRFILVIKTEVFPFRGNRRRTYGRYCHAPFHHRGNAKTLRVSVPPRGDKFARFRRDYRGLS